MWNFDLFSVVFVCFLNYVFSYNVDTVNIVEHSGPEKNSMFGFSVAIHKEQGNSWLIVGAPEAQARYQQTVTRGGAVYRCSVQNDNSCQELPFDTNGDNIDTSGRAIDQKSGQWFGATVNSAGADGPIVVCAPRYVWFTHRRDRRDPVGTCYVSKGDFSSYSEYSPCRTPRYGYHRQGWCQAGLGAGISNDGKRLFVGAPGSWYWQGQIYSIDANAKFPFTPGKYGEPAFGEGQVIQQSLETRPAVVYTREGPTKDDDSYMGYSVAVGDFTGEGVQGVAVGMPRGADLTGKVVLFTWNLTNHQNITGEQLGAYFGYAIATADVDGDRLDDLIIGAPFHTEPNNEGKYEVGRVYVIYQGGHANGRFRSLHFLNGTNSKSRFGLSLASLGDINLDGYGDFAVGAPYDGQNEYGAVYIYHGSSKGVRQAYSQVIYAEDVSNKFPPLQTFGFSISGGLDLDGNDYPDMAVGAYLSNKAYFFRTRPVVVVDATVKFLTPRNEIILEERNCTLHGQFVPCTNVNFCMKYRGRGVPQSIDLHVQYILDSKKTRDPRMFFIAAESKNTLNETWTLYKDKQEICQTKQVYVSNVIRDKLTPLEAEVRYSLHDSNNFEQVRARRFVLTPVLDLSTPTSKNASISIHKNCGSDNICTPDLNLTVTSNVEAYLLNSKGELIFDITVANRGEDAFETVFELTLPPLVNFKKYTKESKKTEVVISCSDKIKDNITIIICDIGNPLPGGKIANFMIHLEPFGTDNMGPTYEFDMFVNTSNPEIPSTTYDNHVHKTVNIRIDAKLELQATSRPSEVHYNASLYTSDVITKETEIGPQIIHIYSLRNLGPSPINQAELFFIWPYATLGDEDLFYLLEQPHTLNDVTCRPVQANYKNYYVDSSKFIWETKSSSLFGSDLSESNSGSGLGIEIGSGAKGTVTSLDSSRTYEQRQVYKADNSGDASLAHKSRHNQSYESSESSGKRLVFTKSDNSLYTIGGGETSVGALASNSSTGSRTYGQGVAYGQRASSGSSRWSSQGQSSYGQGGSVSNVHRGAGFDASQSGSVSSIHRGSGYGASQGGSVSSVNRGSGYDASQGGSVSSVHRGSGYDASQGGSVSSVHRGSGYDASQGGSVSSVHRGSGYDASQGGSVSSVQRGSGYDASQVGSVSSVHRGSGYDSSSQSGSGYGGTYGHAVTTHHVSHPGVVATHQTSGQDSDYRTSYGSGSNQARTVYSVNGSYSTGHNQNAQSSSDGQIHTGLYGNEYGSVEGSSGEYEYGESQGGNTFVGDFTRGSSSNKSGSRQESHVRGYGQYPGSYAISGGSASSGGIGSAALDQGFRTNTLELENIGGQVLTQEGIGTVDGQSYSRGHSSQEGGVHGQIASSKETSSRTAGNRGVGGSSYYESHTWSSHGPQQHTYIGRDNVPTDRPNLNNQYLGKRKRDVDSTDAEIESNINCTAAKCLTIVCTTGVLKRNDEVFVAIRARVNARTLKNISVSQPIKFSSKVLARIEKLPYIGTPKDRILYKTEISTTISAPSPEIKSDIVPLWVVVLSAVAGTIILLLLIFLLYKCGFFKRNRPSSAPERQPLNSNGHYHDEAL